MGIPLKKIKQIKEALFAEVNIGVDDLFDEKGMVKQEFKNAMPFHYSGTSFEEMALELERENGSYRTLNLNPAIRYISELARDSENKKSGTRTENMSYSALVGASRIEP